MFGKISPEVVARHQGDQIGRIFACWEVVYFGRLFLKITEMAQIIGQLLYTVKVMD
jgi:hypothetical protein